MNRKQRRARASAAGAHTKALIRRERGRLAGGPTNEKPAGLAAETELIEMVPTTTMRGLLNKFNSYLRRYQYGPCSVIVTREHGRWHLSIAHPTRYPTWVEISGAWYKAVPGAGSLTAALILPPLHTYINIHSFCMQVNECPPQEDWRWGEDDRDEGADHA